MSHLKKHWRVIVAASLLGLVITCLYVAYLRVTFPHRDPKIENAFDFLCRPSFLTVVCMDVPCTTADYVGLWTFAAISNATIYGAIAGFVAVSVSKVRRLVGTARRNA